MRLAPPITIVWLALAVPAAAQVNESSQPPVTVAPPEGPPIRMVRPPLPSPPPPPPPSLAVGPMPATNPGTWVRTDDYPEWAVEYDVGGTVAVTLDVDADGRVAGCEIRSSSGVPDLDRLACDKITERGRFRPARDARGNPVAGRWQSVVRWELPPDIPEEAPRAGFLTLSFVVEPDGTVTDCEVGQRQGDARMVDLELCRQTERFQPIVGADGKPQRRRIRVTTRIESEPLP